MMLSRNVADAFANLASSKLRSFLAILGILIGTGSVVALISSGELATDAALAQFKSLGTNLLSVSLSQRYSQDTTDVAQQQAQKLTLPEALHITQANPDILIAAPYTSLYASLSYNGNTLYGGTIGATQALQSVIKINLIKGRFISMLDHYSNFCVIGNTIYDGIKKMGVSDPIGTQIRIGSQIFTIVGIAAKWPQNSFFNQDINNSIIIPIQTSFVISKYTKLDDLIFRLKTGANIEPIKKDITTYINNKAPNNNLFIRSAQQLIEKMQAQQRTFTLLLGVIGSISLLVGGIGVMNIMLVSVVERRREIGIRRALGAKKRDIQTLFIIESTILSVFGGFLGVILGITASFIIAQFSGWNFTLFLFPPIIGFTVSAAIGIFFGFYPAYQASHLDPIEALRSD